MTAIATHQTAVLQGIGPGACLTADELASAVGLSPRSAAHAAGKLCVRGLLERVEAGCFQLTEEGEAALASGDPVSVRAVSPRTARPKARDTRRQRVWSAVRIEQRFTVPDLLALVATTGARSETIEVRVYVRMLFRFGYIVLLPRRAKGASPYSNSVKVYRLLRDTGPIGPSAHKGLVWDHNLRRSVDLPGTPRALKVEDAA